MHRLESVILCSLLISYVVFAASSTDSNQFCDKDGKCDGDVSIDKLDEHALVELLLKKASAFPVDLPGIKELIDIKNRIVALQPKQEDYLPKRKSYAEAVKNLNEWAKKELEIQGVAGEVVDGIGLGLVATEDIKEGDNIMRISVKSVISTQQSKEKLACFGTAKSTVSKYPGLWKSLNLSLEILAESYNKDSRFKTYLTSLPNSFIHPIYFSYEDFAALEKSIVFEGSVYTLCEAYTMYAKVWIKFFDDPGCAKEIGFDRKQVTFKAFQWAYTMALTRNYDGSFHDNEVNKVMIPFWDLANHADAAAVETSNDAIGPKSEKSDGVYITYAERDIKKGEPIHMHYLRPLDPIESFATWGFVHMSSYSLKIQIDKSEENHLKMLKQYKKAHDWHEGLVLPDPAYLNGKRLTDYHNKKAIRVLLQIANADENVEYTPKTIEKAWKFLSRQVDKQIAMYETTTEKLEEKRKMAKTENLKTVYTEIIEEIKLLQRIKKYAADAAAN